MKFEIVYLSTVSLKKKITKQAERHMQFVVTKTFISIIYRITYLSAFNKIWE